MNQKVLKCWSVEQYKNWYNENFTFYRLEYKFHILTMEEKVGSSDEILFRRNWWWNEL